MSNSAPISKEKIDECWKVFSTFDKDASNCISTSEIAEALKLVGYNPTQEDLSSIIKEYDKDRSGLLEFPEFLQIVAKNIRDSNTEEELFEGLRLLDRENNGMISSDDLKLFMMNIGERLTEKEANEILLEIDPNNSGYVSYKELFGSKKFQ